MRRLAGAAIVATAILAGTACTSPLGAREPAPEGPSPAADADQIERARLLAEWQRVFGELQSSVSLPVPAYTYPADDPSAHTGAYVIRLYDVRDIGLLIEDFPGYDCHLHSGE